MPGIEFKAIAAALDAETFARHELPMRGNRAKCPFCPPHSGQRQHYNLAFYRDGKCHCFRCSGGGDSVTLAAATWHCSQKDAAERLNREYSLGLSAEGPDPEIMRQQQRTQAQRDAAQKERENMWLSHYREFGPAADQLQDALAVWNSYTIQQRKSCSAPDVIDARTQLTAAKANLYRVWESMTGITPTAAGCDMDGVDNGT